jgi:hypothetical protein
MHACRPSTRLVLVKRKLVAALNRFSVTILIVSVTTARSYQRYALAFYEERLGLVLERDTYFEEYELATVRVSRDTVLD